jgi:outer membrane receptor protein involved in Fe transport
MLRCGKCGDFTLSVITGPPKRLVESRKQEDRMRTFQLMMSVAVAAIATTATAQDNSPATTTASSAAPADVSENAGEIIVTATRRADTVANVPIAISAVSAATLQNSGANDIRQLNQVAPSLLVSSTGSEANGSARIRGIGTVGDNPGLESSVAVFIDGVYRSRSGIGLNELGEVDRIEVLRGPQGTLFGRNASAGLIHIITKAPTFDGLHVNGEATYGNYDNIRVAGGVNVPLGDTLAARVDGVYVNRNGFYHDATNNTDVNDRNRYFVRGQLLFQPTDDLKVRIIGDYTHRNEKCCAAVYVAREDNPYIGNLNNPVASVNAGLAAGNDGNNIVNVLRDLGQPLSRFSNTYSREISVSPGRSFAGKTTDGGISAEVNYDFGGATITSITAYRDYKATQGGDIDYSSVDILYRAPGNDASRKFKTFTQELRLQGSAFDDKLDWLVGGFYADEKLTVRDNLRFGNQYGRFATCRAVSGGGLAAFYSPTGAACLTPTGRGAIASGAVTGSAASGAILLQSFDNLDSLNNKGSTVDVYNQDSRNYAFFTHNIFHVTDNFSITLGARYTNERKKFNATFGNDNTVCTANQAALAPFLTTALAATAGGIIGLSCQGNSTAELNGVSIHDQRNEHKFTGTAVVSYKPSRDFMTYASYSRGYKSGGFNLDRSALKSPILPFSASGAGNSAAGAQALVKGLQFDPETVTAYEIGGKYSSRMLSVNVAIFRQEFKNFQLNTFDGTVFIVQNVNGCTTDLGLGDNDQSKFTGASNYNAAAATTGACAAGNVGYGVRSQGIEVEASLRPVRDVTVGLGFTYADTKYRDNLVGNASGAPLNQALRKLPGDNLSNAPKAVGTASFAWTPDIGNSGLSGLFYIDGRMTGDYNTGSDLFPQKEQDSYAVFNARVGIRGPQEKWALEFWGQNIFKQNYAQVAFNSPFQEGGVSAAFQDPQYPGGRQLFSQFLAEPRTYGVTARFKF